MVSYVGAFLGPIVVGLLNDHVFKRFGGDPLFDDDHYGKPPALRRPSVGHIAHVRSSRYCAEHYMPEIDIGKWNLSPAAAKTAFRRARLGQYCPLVWLRTTGIEA